MARVRFRWGAFAAALIACALTPASSQAVIFVGSSGSLSASAEFTLSGSTLTVVLTNTSPNDVQVPTDVLTGVFFNTTSTLTPVSAALNGSTVNYAALPAGGVGAGWQYKNGVNAQ